MSLLARLAPHLPYVRRYARALTGDQTTGDHYVRVALEALAAGERTLADNMTPRVALYHVFHAIWCTSGAQLETRDDDDQTSAQDDTTHRLMRIAPRSGTAGQVLRFCRDRRQHVLEPRRGRACVNGRGHESS